MTTTDRNSPHSRRPVLHDPLLHGPQIDGPGVDGPAVRSTDGVPPAPPVPPPPAPQSRRKSKHPALSARILATGLATTGTLGLTAGYALSAPGKSTDTTLPTTATLPTAAGTPQGGTTATLPAPAVSTPANTAPAVPATSAAAPAPVATVAPPVVVLQIPSVAPANPGSSAGSGGKSWQGPANQQSSGSN